VLGFVNPFLLWGLAAVAAPVLIHLLLRQRPRPRPWAAMEWLRRARQAASRRWKLTNLLLLLLRCLLIALLALALARPSLAGLGSGGRLVLVVDTTASMGPRGDGPSALDDLRTQVAAGGLGISPVCLVTVDRQVRSPTGGEALPPGELLRTLAHIEASAYPGGLDRAAEPGLADALLAHCPRDADVVLISDFRQDEGRALANLLRGRVRSVSRLRLGEDGENARLAGVESWPDPVPGHAAMLTLRLDGRPAGARLAVDDAAPLPMSLTVTDGLAGIEVPPLPAGRHRLVIELVDRGLACDNRLDLHLAVRGALPALVATEGRSYLATALEAASRFVEPVTVAPVDLAAQVLPAEGLVVLRGRAGGSAALRDWVGRGGVLWTTAEILANGDLAALAGTFAVEVDRILPGGTLTAGESVLDAVLRRVTVANVPAARLPGDAEVLLRAGSAPLVVALPSGQGMVLVELLDLDRCEPFWTQGGCTLWVQQTVRDLTARRARPLVLEAGTPAPRDLTVARGDVRETVAAGAPLLIAPGAWTTGPAGGERPVLVLPSSTEARLRAAGGDGLVTSLATALPDGRGADWAMPLLLAALLLALGEGAFAAWAGRAYGR